MVTLAPIPPGALAKYDPQIDFPTVAEAGWNGDDLLGIGGLSWTKGRCWLWYRVVDRNHHEGNSVHPHAIVRGGLRMLRRARQMGETQVFAWRDDSEPSSKRLLEVIGFKPIGTEDVMTTNGRIERKEVWLWQTP
jgi:hypothetical protein